jgi:hypothetical protein
MPAILSALTLPSPGNLSRGIQRVIRSIHGDEELQQRIEELARKANEGELTEEERAEP